MLKSIAHISKNWKIKYSAASKAKLLKKLIIDLIFELFRVSSSLFRKKDPPFSPSENVSYSISE